MLGGVPSGIQVGCGRIRLIVAKSQNQACHATSRGKSDAVVRIWHLLSFIEGTVQRVKLRQDW